jgi:NADH-quinone oxidoreductase subunit N
MATGLAICIAGGFMDLRRCWGWIAAAGLLAAASTLYSQSVCQWPGQCLPHSGPFALDCLAYYARWLALAFAGLLVLLASGPLAGSRAAEPLGSVLVATAGLMLAAGAGNLVLLIVGLELISIPTYILLYLGPRETGAQEATVKYFFLGLLASAMLLAGLGFLYGASGSLELPAICQRLADPQTPSAGFAALALVLILAGLGFKIAVVPLHFYAPDVYQGTTYANAALLSSVPKAAGLIVLLRIAAAALPQVGNHAWQIALVLAMLTMTVGNVMALWQDNLRRLLAYCAIAQAGYLLMGLAAGLVPGEMPRALCPPAALLFHLCAYALAMIGTFAALGYLGRGEAQVEAVDELAGLGRTRPLPAALLAVFMFSLAGMPPLAGFWGKLALLGSVLSVPGTAPAGGGLHPWFTALAIVAVLNIAVAAAYHVRIVAVVYFRTPLAVPKAQGGPGPWLAAATCAALTIVVGLCPGPLWRESADAGRAASVVVRERRQNGGTVPIFAPAKMGPSPSGTQQLICKTSPRRVDHQGLYHGAAGNRRF